MEGVRTAISNIKQNSLEFIANIYYIISNNDEKYKVKMSKR